MKRVALSSLLLFVFFFSRAQDVALYRQKFMEGNMLILEGNYHEALKNFMIAFQIDSANANINYKVGLCYLKSVSEKVKAKKYLEEAAKDVSKNYLEDEPREKKAPIFTYKYLGQAYHLDYKFDKAVENFEKFKTFLSPGKHTEWIKEADRAIEVCGNAKTIIASPINVKINNLGDSINSAFPEYGPVLSADESMIIYTSRRPGSTGGEKTLDNHYYEDIYISYKSKDRKWSGPVSIGPNINTYGNEATISLSADGQQLLIYKDDNGDGNIYLSTYLGDGYSAPEIIGGDISLKSFEPSACVSADGNTLYFVSDRKGGVGGKDIWRSVRLPNGQWSLATNLGAPINTEYDEDSPFIHPDGVTLFFSSTGHKSIGGFDIFFSTKKRDKEWSEPLNIGYPINTTDDDVYYVSSPDGKRGYYSSIRPEGYGETDIYMFSLVDPVSVVPVTLLKGFLSFADGKVPPDVRIVVVDIETGETVLEVRPNPKTGKYILALAPGSQGKKYSITYEATGYQPINETLQIQPGTTYQELDKELELELISFDKNDAGSITVSGVVTRTDGKPIANTKIVVKNNKTGQLLGTYYTNTEKGFYSFIVRKGKDINVTYEAESYLFQSENVNTPAGGTTHGEMTKNIVLQPIKAGATMVMNNIFFDYNKSTLRGTSTLELQKLLNFMKDNATVRIEVSGHTDTRGSDVLNMKLSDARAKAVTAWMIKKGIDKNRIEAKGYGETKPVAQEILPNGKPDVTGMQQNRRVELKIME